MHERELWEVYKENDLLREELTVLESQLISCECDEDGEKKKKNTKEKEEVTYSMPTASSGSSEATTHQKLRKDGQHHSLRQDIGVRGHYLADQEKLTEQMMEELG